MSTSQTAGAADAGATPRRGLRPRPGEACGGIFATIGVLLVSYGFLLIGLIIALADPALARRVGQALVEDAGLEEAPAPASS